VLPSFRFVVLFAAGCILFFVEHAVLYYNAVILALLLVDFWISHEQPFSVERDCDHILSLGVENPVRIYVENKSQFPLSVRIKDECPQGILVSEKEVNIKIPPYEERKILYSVIPFKRGEYEFGRVFVRRKSYMGLWVFEKTVDLNTQAKVYPNVQMVKKYDLLSRKQLLSLLGIKPAKLYGRGTEFEMLREYQVDDEYRVIDWKATSKRGKPISRVYQVERTKTVVLMVDTGRIMGIHIGNLTKLEHTVNSALLVSFVALRLGERVGLCIFSSDIKEYIPPQGRRPHFNVIMEALYNLKADSYESDYKKAFEYVSLKNRKRSLVLIYTDLIEKDISQRLIQYLAALQKTHLPLCVAVKDTNIIEIAAREPRTEREVYQKAVALTLLRERNVAMGELSRRGVRVVDELPGRLTVSTLNKYLELKHTMRI
jgi:uncharacterized protein (DUF58 family)